MPGGSSVLKEFLVKIGFKVDEAKFRHFQEAMHTTAKNAVEMSKTALAATTVMGAGLKAAAHQMEGLYFATRRTGASARELKDLGFAAEQVGVSADQARGALEGLAAARRTNPGLNGILGGMGIDPRQTDNAKVLVQLLAKLHSMPYYQGAQIAGMFGINEQTFAMLEQGLPEMQKYLVLRDKMFHAAGINPDDMTARSHEFMVHVRTLEAALGLLTDVIAYRLMPAGEKVIDWLVSVVAWFTKADKATDGWSSKLLGIVSALAGGSLLKGGFGLLGKLLGRGSAAAAESEAGEGAAGLLAGGGALTAGLVAALIGLLTVVFSKTAAEWVRNKLGMPEKVTGETIKNAWGKTGIPAALDKAVSFFEGHAKRGYGVYKDVAGHLTAGFGHLVRPGENLSNLDQQGALALLAKDLAAARNAVMSLVKVKLSQNQLGALTDFEFNVGRDKFAHSTLLRKLNAGNYSGASDQFQYWNHALVDGHMMALAGLTARRQWEANMFRRGDDRPVTVSQKNEYHVASTDPNGAASEIERRQSRINADLVRNLSGAVQ